LKEQATQADWDQQGTVSVTQAAKILGISRGSAFSAVHRGEIPALRLGHRLVVPTAALKKMLESPSLTTGSAS
jgi:excisionase family DNA binding protein